MRHCFYHKNASICGILMIWKEMNHEFFTKMEVVYRGHSYGNERKNAI